jgi:hypothetical protein
MGTTCAAKRFISPGERFASFSRVLGSSTQEAKCAAVSSHGATQNAGDLEVAVGKKLRKRAAKPMKSLARVNLCRLGVRCQLRRRSAE